MACELAMAASYPNDQQVEMLTFARQPGIMLGF